VLLFTGLIEEMGKVISIQRSSVMSTLLVEAKKVTKDLPIGSSVAVNGACLTAIRVSGSTFAAQISSETLNRTNLGKLTPGTGVNLERAMALGERLEGHIVSGHVDAVGTISRILSEGQGMRIWIETPPQLRRYIVEKGSIAVDGISLTVAGVDQNTFWIAVIPHTLKETTLGQARVEQGVNLEADVLAKYIESLLEYRKEGIK
jgi:riboflavin synthase